MIALGYSGPIEAGERLIAPIREFGPPLVDLVRPMPYSEMNTLIDTENPPGQHNYWKWNGLKGVTDEVIDAVVEAFARVPSPQTAVIIDQLHGTASRVPADATAFAHREAPHGLVISSTWTDAADTEANITWTRELAAATAPYSTGGVYVNSAAGDKAEATYGSNYQRLSAIKAKYDPTNFFRSNQNIKPAS